MQISRWLGHSSPGFTLDRYIHLMDEDDLGGPMEPVSPAACPAVGSNGSEHEATAEALKPAA